MKATIKPGDLALAVLTVPKLRLLCVRVVRVWVSCAGSVRCDVEGTESNGLSLRRGTSFDSRRLLPLSALENLSGKRAAAEVAAPEVTETGPLLCAAAAR